MNSTEKAIQAATEITRNHTFSQDEEWRGYLVGVAKEAVEAALASGELHAADECPNLRSKEYWRSQQDNAAWKSEGGANDPC